MTDSTADTKQADKTKAEPKTEENKQQNKGSKTILLIAGLGIGAIALFFGYRWWRYASTHSYTNDAYVTNHIYPVNPRITGTVIEVLAREFALLPPSNATGNFTKIVQRVPVKILFDPQSVKGYENSIVPGMSVEVGVVLDGE